MSCPFHLAEDQGTVVVPITETVPSVFPLPPLEREPWICPRCKTVNAPHVDKCGCPA